GPVLRPISRAGRLACHLVPRQSQGTGLRESLPRIRVRAGASGFPDHPALRGRATRRPVPWLRLGTRDPPEPPGPDGSVELCPSPTEGWDRRALPVPPAVRCVSAAAATSSPCPGAGRP